jgi:hypothetical protein
MLILINEQNIQHTVNSTVVLIMNIYFLLRMEPEQNGSGNSAGSLDRLSATPTRKGICSGE